MSIERAIEDINIAHIAINSILPGTILALLRYWAVCSPMAIVEGLLLFSVISVSRIVFFAKVPYADSRDS